MRSSRATRCAGVHVRSDRRAYHLGDGRQGEGRARLHTEFLLAPDRVTTPGVPCHRLVSLTGRGDQGGPSRARADELRRLDSRLLCWLLLLTVGCGARDDPLPNEGMVAAIKVADFPGYSEGIAFDPAGTAYVSAGRNPGSPHAVYRLLAGQPPVAWLNLRIPNGHKVLRDGTHLIAAEGVIVRVASTGRPLDSLTTYATGEYFRRPNDIARDGHGGFYFTDPGLPDASSGNGKLFYVDSLLHITTVTSGFCYPNGLVVRADGREIGRA